MSPKGRKATLVAPTKPAYNNGMTREDYMHQAIEAALQAEAAGGVAIGAVLVHTASGQVVSSGGSEVMVRKDPTAHAEICCIREAARSLNTPHLGDYTLYSTLEPCHMCLSAAAWAQIPLLYFGAYRKDVDPSLFDINGSFSDEAEANRMNLRAPITMRVEGGILEADCAKLLEGYPDLGRSA